MKLPLCLALPLFAILTVPTTKGGDEPSQVSLEVLRKKIAAKEAERAQQPQGGSQLSGQLKLLQSLIERGDLARASQMLDNNMLAYGLPPELQEEWIRIVEQLRKELENKQAEATEAWRKEIDQLVAETKAACLSAKSSVDLDPLLIRCAALQMCQDRRNTVQSERSGRKLSGAASLLETWADFLDFRDAGNTKRANDILRNLRTNNSNFPILSVQDIDGRFVLNDADSLTVREAFPKIFHGVASPDDLPGALDRLKSLAANPMNPELNSLRTEQRRLEAVMQAWEAVKNGDDASALKALERANNSGGFDDASSYYEPLKSRILSTVMQRKTQSWSKLTLNPGEEPAAFLGRILDELQTKGDYPTMVEVMKFSDQMSRPNGVGAFTAERQAIERFRAGQRLEAAGDPLGAMTNYRSVIASAGGKYVPTAQAQEAFKKLQEKNPELFKSADAALLEEIRSLKMMIQSMMARMGAGRPPYPMPGE